MIRTQNMILMPSKISLAKNTIPFLSDTPPCPLVDGGLSFSDQLWLEFFYCPAAAPGHILTPPAKTDAHNCQPKKKLETNAFELFPVILWTLAKTDAHYCRANSKLEEMHIWAVKALQLSRCHHCSHWTFHVPLGIINRSMMLLLASLGQGRRS